MKRTRRNVGVILAHAGLAVALFGAETPAFAARRAIGGPGSCGSGESVTGVYLSRDRTLGGGAYLTIEPSGSPLAVNVTEAVYAVAGGLAPGTLVRLVARAANGRNPMSGSGGQPPFDCVETAR